MYKPLSFVQIATKEITKPTPVSLNPPQYPVLVRLECGKWEWISVHWTYSFIGKLAVIPTSQSWNKN
jgi:hypothetical protein